MGKKQSVECLTDSWIARLSWRLETYSLPDRKGLRLNVSPSGKKTWQLRAVIKGKDALMTIGYWPEMSVRSARSRAHKLRAAIKAGEDPRLTRQIISSISVSAFSKRWLMEIVSTRRKDPREVQRVLDRDILPALGRLPIRKVMPSDIRSLVYRRRDEGKPAAAIKMHAALGRLFDYARNCGLILRNPVAEVDKKYLGRLKSRTRALSTLELGAFYRGLRSPRLGFRSAVALELLLLTLARKGELREARWKHIDFEAATWEVPAELSKTGVPHIVYLSPRAVEVFKSLWPLDGELPGTTHAHSGTRRVDPEEFVLQAASSRTQPMSEPLLNRAVARVKWGIPHFTIHDLRRTGSTILNEQGYKPDVIEKALNHAVRGGVRGVYNRAQYSEERRQMLREWADFLGKFRDAS